MDTVPTSRPPQVTVRRRSVVLAVLPSLLLGLVCGLATVHWDFLVATPKPALPSRASTIKRFSTWSIVRSVETRYTVDSAYPSLSVQDEMEAWAARSGFHRLPANAPAPVWRTSVVDGVIHSAWYESEWSTAGPWAVTLVVWVKFADGQQAGPQSVHVVVHPLWAAASHVEELSQIDQSRAADTRSP